MQRNLFFYYIQVINQQSLKYYYLILYDYHFAFISCIYLLVFIRNVRGQEQKLNTGSTWLLLFILAKDN